MASHELLDVPSGAPDDLAAFERLEKLHGIEWPLIRRARANTRDLFSRIASLGLPESLSTSLVAFGSAGRLEFTSESDLDWSVLVDGPADPEHVTLLARVREALRDVAAEPGPIFGALVSSHELIHHIGGFHDTNLNLTIRMLLLLESRSLNNSVVYERVMRMIFARYITFSASVAWKQRPRRVVPRFLLNDVVRYWRTITVDYAAKRWEQGEWKWSLRNAKLRMSRKMLFLAGLILCLKFELDHPREREEFVKDLRTFPDRFAGFLFNETSKSPIDALSEVLLRYPAAAAHSLLDPYDEFLAILDDHDKRLELEQLRFDDAENSVVFTRIRQLGDAFHQAVVSLFFNDDFRPMMADYGVF
ncbi:MAG TPA: hypothetical protein VN380_26420 [Thermoanaerobaculia bacterium]|nr:hypothetical protein [Thermoanaerobaculia bacterium]